MATTSSPIETLAARVAAGRNGGGWNGSGIRSTVAGASGLYGIGIAEASDVLKLSGGQTAVWLGNTVNEKTVLLRYTYAGDFDLNGRIDADDYFRVDTGYSSGATGYAAGNLNYTGLIDGDDYFWLDHNYATQGPPIT